MFVTLLKEFLGNAAGKTIDVSEDHGRMLIQQGVAQAAADDPLAPVVAGAMEKALSRLSDQDLTHTVIGMFRNVARSTYDDAARAQVQLERENRSPDLQALLNGRDTWSVAD